MIQSTNPSLQPSGSMKTKSKFSPDQNIIEHVWDHIDCQMHTRRVQPCNVDELWAALQEEWDNMSIAYIQKLYNSILRRIEALCLARGRYMKY